MDFSLVAPISKSFGSDFKKCPWVPFAKKALGLRTPGSTAATNGKNFHGLAEPLLEGRIEIDEALDLSPNSEVRGFLEKWVSQVDLNIDQWSYDQIVEAYFRLNDDGKTVDAGSVASFHGYLDFTWVRRSDNRVVCTDWKTSISEDYDDKLERDGYIAGTLSLYPLCRDFAFQRHFVRTGNIHEWTYSMSDDLSQCVVVGPKGDRVVMKSSGNRPAIMSTINEIVDLVKNTPETPIPGEQCHNWYGGPCPFLGGECPVAGGLPSVFVSGGISNETTTRLTDALLRSDMSNLTHGDMSDLLAHTFQAEAFIGKVFSKIHEWAGIHGDITLNGDRYGWIDTPERVVDKVRALDMMGEAGMSVEDVAKAVNLSLTSLSKIPLHYAGLREYVIAETVTEVFGSKRRFGKRR